MLDEADKGVEDGVGEEEARDGHRGARGSGQRGGFMALSIAVPETDSRLCFFKPLCFCFFGQKGCCMSVGITFNVRVQRIIIFHSLFNVEQFSMYHGRFAPQCMVSFLKCIDKARNGYAPDKLLGINAYQASSLEGLRMQHGITGDEVFSCS